MAAASKIKGRGATPSRSPARKEVKAKGDYPWDNGPGEWPELPAFLKRTDTEKDRLIRERLIAGPIQARAEPASTRRSEMAKKSTAAASGTSAREALEGKSISELVTIHNEKAEALGQAKRSTFKNAEAGIKAILGLELTAQTPAPKGGGKGGKAPETKPAAKKAPPKDTRPRGEYGEIADSNKGRLIAIMVKNVGKPVKAPVAIEAVYGKGAEDKDAAFKGVLLGAQIAFKEHGGELVYEGRGKEATLTLTLGNGAKKPAGKKK